MASTPASGSRAPWSAAGSLRSALAGPLDAARAVVVRVEARGGLAASLVERAAGVGRDAGTVVRGLMGIRARPYIERHQARFAHLAPRQVSSFAAREVEVVEVIRETADATTLRFRPLAGPAFAPTPGQFFTLELPDPSRREAAQVEGTLRRAYSCSSVCSAEELPAVTVKRVPGGRASSWIHDEARVGLRLRVFGPSGSFGLKPDPSRRRALLLVAGGSGITPLMAITRTVLAVEPETRIALVYGSRSEADVIFLAALDDLARRYPSRLHVVHALETPAPPESVARHEGTFATGRLDAATFSALAGALPPGLRPAPEHDPMGVPDVYVCGPTTMMAAVREALVAAGQPEARIHQESFLRPTQQSQAPSRAQPVVLRKAGVDTRVVVPAGKTLLEAGLAAGVVMPYSCAMGGCAACKVALVEGQVAMEEPNCLDAAERQRGFVLGCVARPTAPCVVEVP